MASPFVSNAGLGVLGSAARVMGLQTLVQIIGPAAVQRTVRTGKYIGIVHLAKFLCIPG